MHSVNSTAFLRVVRNSFKRFAKVPSFCDLLKEPMFAGAGASSQSVGWLA